MKKELYIVIGAYGSGKSEYAIHLARKLNDEGEEVILADMDVVNPYFRSRDVRDEFEELGIEVIAPDGGFKHADLPMISPRIKGAVENYNKTVILDVGGDPAGCRTLGRFVDAANLRGYQMHFVINTCRPFTGTVEDILVMREVLEFSSKLKITELLCNTNLMQYTDEETVLTGIKIVDEVAQKMQVDFKTYLVLDEYSGRISENLLGKKREIMNYTLKKPWEHYNIKAYKV